MRPSEMLSAHREEIREIARAHGAASVWVFGSASRGEDTAGSDLDLLVELQPGRTLLDLGAMWAALTELLGCAVDIATTGGLSEEERAQIQRVSL